MRVSEEIPFAVQVGVCGRTFETDQRNARVRGCERKATWHVIWTKECENGTCCDEHMEEVRRNWVFFAVHRMLPACTQEGSFYSEDLNVCLMPDDFNVGVDLEASVERELEPAVKATAEGENDG